MNDVTHIDGPDLVIPARPQITVEMVDGGIEISTASINDAFDNVDFSEVTIPFDDVEAVIGAMRTIMQRWEG